MGKARTYNCLYHRITYSHGFSSSWSQSYSPHVSSTAPQAFGISMGNRIGEIAAHTRRRVIHCIRRQKGASLPTHFQLLFSPWQTTSLGLLHHCHSICGAFSLVQWKLFAADYQLKARDALRSRVVCVVESGRLTRVNEHSPSLVWKCKYRFPQRYIQTGDLHWFYY